MQLWGRIHPAGRFQPASCYGRARSQSADESARSLKAAPQFAQIIVLRPLSPIELRRKRHVIGGLFKRRQRRLRADFRRENRTRPQRAAIEQVVDELGLEEIDA